MNLSTLKPAEGSKHSTNFRVGRGHGSGNGKTAGKGHKGQKARSGSPRPGFEGGQMPLYRRIPKRGFTCINHKDIVENPRDGVKILGNGELTKKLTVKANAFSKSAVEKIEALGGKAEVI